MNMSKAMELATFLNAESVKGNIINRYAYGRVIDLLKILDIIEHEILEESPNLSAEEIQNRANKYEAILEHMKKDTFSNEGEGVFDVIIAMKGDNRAIAYDLLYNNYTINDLYAILTLLNNNDIIAIIDKHLDEYLQDKKLIRFNELKGGR